MREFLLKTDKGIFIHKLALQQNTYPGSEYGFTPWLFPRSFFRLLPAPKSIGKAGLKFAW